MRVRRIKNVEEKILKYDNIIMLDPASLKGKWRELFKNDNPIYLEIGMGLREVVCSDTFTSVT